MHGLVGLEGESHMSSLIVIRLTFDTGSLSELGLTIGLD